MRLLVPIVLPVLGAGFQAAVLSPLGAETTYIALVLAVVLSGLTGGLLSGALATALSGILGITWLHEGLLEAGDWLALGTFVAGGLLVSVVCDAALEDRARLLRSERLLNEMGRMARVGGWAVDLKSMRMEWTEETRRIHEVPEGVTPSVEEGIGFYHPEDRPKISEVFRRAVEKGEAYDVELRIVTARGNVRWVRAMGHALHEGGAPAAVLGAFQDVTEKHEAAAALRASEEKYRLLAENAADLVAVLDPDGVLRYASPASLALDGHLPEELVGQRVSELLVVPEDLPVVRSSMDRHASGEELVQARFRIRRKDGRVIWVERKTRAIRNAATGEIVELHAVLRDVTEAVEAEAELKRHRDHLEELVGERTESLRASEDSLRLSEQRLRLATDGASTGTWYWDVSSGRLEWSELCKVHLALPPGRTPSFEHFYEVMHPEDRARVERLLRETAERREDYVAEYRIRQTDGSWRWIRGMGRYYVSAGGELEGMGGVTLDVTAGKGAEDELRAARDRLAAANVELAKAARMKDEFLASRSHEMRTPLTAIVGTAEHLRALPDGVLPPEALAHVESVATSGRRLQELVDDLLDVARLDAGKVKAMIAPSLAADVVEAAARRYRAAATEKGQELAVSVDPEGLVLSTDAARLAQLLGCLLSNAVKFTPPGGRIGVNAKGDAGAGVARISVCDTGIGIAAGDVGHLFNSFVQLDGRAEREYGGLGLGLALARRLTQLLGGTIAVESAPGEGTGFTITLPWTERTVGTTTGGAPAPSPGPATAPVDGPTRGLAQRVPADLRAALHAAVERADAEEIEALAARLEERDAEVARLVRDLAHHFDYDSLLRELGPSAT